MIELGLLGDAVLVGVAEVAVIVVIVVLAAAEEIQLMEGIFGVEVADVVVFVTELVDLNVVEVAVVADEAQLLLEETFAGAAVDAAVVGQTALMAVIAEAADVGVAVDVVVQ